jgi:hypothetical protein
LDKNVEIKLLLLEEQSLLSRERRDAFLYADRLAFTSVGLLIIKFLAGFFYFGDH